MNVHEHTSPSHILSQMLLLCSTGSGCFFLEKAHAHSGGKADRFISLGAMAIKEREISSSKSKIFRTQLIGANLRFIFHYFGANLWLSGEESPVSLVMLGC